MQIQENAIFTGREVKRMLEEARNGVRRETPARWLTVTDAAAILRIKPDTLRRRCARWYRMEDPPVRTRKQSDAPNAPWLLDESGVWGLTRRAPLETDRPPVAEKGTYSAGVGEEVDQLSAYWCDRVTRNL